MAEFDVAIIGAGAAGLATAIFTRRLNPDGRVALIDGARTPGAKILVSGGSRCNVTNRTVTERDFNGGTPAAIRKVLRALPVAATIEFFRELGVSLHEEPEGKLFPDSNSARQVLNALLDEARRVGVEFRFGTRVPTIARTGTAFQIGAPSGVISAQRVVLATGGLSLPKTGSDGAGYGFATRLGHTLVPTTPALVPLVLDPSVDTTHRDLSGVAQPARIDVRIEAGLATQIKGSLLWTHFGVSGPAALDVSRHWLRARLEQRRVSLTVSLASSSRFEDLEREWIALASSSPAVTLQSVLARQLPASVAAAVVAGASIPAARKLAELSRDERRRALHRLLSWPLAVVDSRGYNYAEVTAGGVSLAEVDPSSMASRVCPGLYLVGEVLDVDGRLGGFNFRSFRDLRG